MSTTNKLRLQLFGIAFLLIVLARVLTVVVPAVEDWFAYDVLVVGILFGILSAGIEKAYQKGREDGAAHKPAV
jgi:hypothetical protein